jgi:hypothetical protein
LSNFRESLSNRVFFAGEKSGEKSPFGEKYFEKCKNFLSFGAFW